MHAKGLELAAYEPRRAVGQGLGYAVSNRGGCHLNGGYLVILEGLGLHVDTQTPKAKADFTMLFQDLMETISASGQCLFTSYAFFPGFLLTKPNGLITQTVNKVATHVPQDPNDPKTRVPLETMKKTYYAARGWDRNGIPTEATLRRLKIK